MKKNTLTAICTILLATSAAWAQNTPPAKPATQGSVNPISSQEMTDLRNDIKAKTEEAKTNKDPNLAKSLALDQKAEAACSKAPNSSDCHQAWDEAAALDAELLNGEVGTGDAKAASQGKPDEMNSQNENESENDTEDNQPASGR